MLYNKVGRSCKGNKRGDSEVNGPVCRKGADKLCKNHKAQLPVLVFKGGKARSLHKEKAFGIHCEVVACFGSERNDNPKLQESNSKENQTHYSAVPFFPRQVTD